MPRFNWEGLGWKPVETMPQDGSDIWLCKMVGAEPQDVHEGSAGTVTNGATHWKPRLATPR